MPQRQLRRKRLYWIVGLLSITAVAVHALHVIQMKRHAAALLARAEQEERDGQLEPAAEYFRRYLTLAPNDPGALARYGFLLDKLAVTPVAKQRVVTAFERVVGLDR